MKEIKSYRNKKSYTDLEQSKELSKILPIQSADFSWRASFNGETNKWEHDFVPTPHCFHSYIGEPCWSLEALMEILPESIAPDNGSNQVYKMCVYNYDGQHCVDYIGEVDGDSYMCVAEDSFVDACAKMIIKLKENDAL